MHDQNAIDGRFMIAGEAIAADASFVAYDPTLGETIAPPFAVSGSGDVERACAAADAAFDAFRETDPQARAGFLDAVADEIEALGDPLIVRAMQESGLARGRLEGERARTATQFRLFARVLRRGAWAGVTIDPARPDRQPLPRPALRQRRIPIGPVAVFGAANFPLAYSVAGGDTAAALAAGCPVIAKGHPAHPGAAALAGQAVARAARRTGMPAGVFSLVQGPGNDLGMALVADPRVKAVGFTGSRAGGLALLAIAQDRPEPIPVFAEMSSINPVVLFPAALAAGAEALGRGFVASLTSGAGQYCTNPGLILALAGPALDRFAAAAAAVLRTAAAQVMLTGGIHQAFETGTATLAAHPAVDRVAAGATGSGPHHGRAALFRTNGAAFRADPALAAEVFGAASLIVACRDTAEIAAVIAGLEGQLTATLHLDDADLPAARALLPLLERKAGRIVANGWPTGLEVGDATVHGGPYPATADGRSTSVGSAAIERFLRPVCYQDLPDALLPLALRHANPLGLPRVIDGKAE